MRDRGQASECLGMDGTWVQFFRADSSILAYALILVLAAVFAAVFRRFEAAHQASLDREIRNSQEHRDDKQKMTEAYLKQAEASLELSSAIKVVIEGNEQVREGQRRLENKFDRRLPKTEKQSE